MEDLTLTFITIIFDIFATLISLIVFIIIIHYLFKQQTKKEDKIVLILSGNIFIFILIYGIISISFCFNTIFGELYNYNYGESSWCIFRGYSIVIIIYALYSIFIIQAAYRLFRIVYSSRKRLQVFWLYIFAGPIGLVFGSIILSPILIWNDIKYLSIEHYCFISFFDIRGIVWMVGSVYAFPLLIVLYLYIRITLFIRRHSHNQIFLIRHQRERDLQAIRRITITVCILFGVGLPCTVFLIMMIITGVEHPLTYRILFFTTSMSMLALDITTVVFTPQLKRIIIKKWQQNRVEPGTSVGRNVIPMKNIAMIGLTV